ncbi:DUF5666 domain-containing protein [Candidatus Accumulibacter cognatus]|uniref:DUF5666 domain-containing protein n=1 Tax=Candidatus Accumulibacter cognatus TaxID=2954383 RepID=A0A080M9R6_9PROT|nr:DUF5666 domain-containing protein [Candidatus Accumulibacter cognatus]KFB77190.1 MAG: hypothetical protein AW06_001741 [Candidatus Accumulibacter cognatus]
MHRSGRLAGTVFSALLAAVMAVPAQANPCADQRWLPAPIVELAVSGVLPAPVAAAAPRVSGDDDEVGLGGTGLRSENGAQRTTVLARPSNDDGEEGIGGTGVSTGHGDSIGLVGVVAGFASICVNGWEVHYEDSTPTRVDGTPSSTSVLALGQSISLRAVLRAGGYHATEISVLHAVQGPVQQLDPAAGTLVVLGQNVRLAGDAQAGIALGDHLSVSGNRLSDGSIVALRIARAPGDAPASLIGPVASLDGQSLRIGQLTVHLPPGSGLSNRVRVGEEVLVQGVLRTDTLLEAQKVHPNPRTSFAADVDRLQIQGLLRHHHGTQIDIDGTRIALPAADGGELPVAGSRVQVSARFGSDDRLLAESWRVERPVATDDPAARRNLRGNAWTSGRSRGETVQEGGADVLSTQQLEGIRPAASGGAPSASEVPQLPTNPAERLEAQRPPPGPPDLLRPEGARPDVQRPTLPRPEIVRPENIRPESRPEVWRPDLPRPRR